MKTLNKIVYALALAGVVSMAANSTAVFANDSCDHAAGKKAHFAEMVEKHQAKLHDKLGLSESQAASWKTFVDKTKPTDLSARPDLSELRKLPAPERLDHMLSMMKEREKHMESMAAAVKEFYAKLTPEQQKIFDDEFQHRGRQHRWYGRTTHQLRDSDAFQHRGCQ